MSQPLTVAVLKYGQRLAQEVLSHDVIKIGRLRTSHIWLNDDCIARMHAVIEVSGADVRVIDLGSPTGTFLNRRRVEKSDVLRSGDVLEFGPFRVEVGFDRLAGLSAAGPGSHGSPGAATAAAGLTARAPTALRPAGAAHIDAGEIEVQDGSRVTEVIASYGRTVLDVQHVGQVKHKRRQAAVLVLLGSSLFLGGTTLLAHDIAQDWQRYEIDLKAASKLELPPPTTPGLGLGGLGLGLALLGLVPFALGFLGIRDRGSEHYTLGEGPHASFPAPTEHLPDNVALALVGGGAEDPTLQFVREMSGEVSLGGLRLSLAELVSSGHARPDGSAFRFALPPGARCRVQHGDLTFHVNSVAPGRVFGRHHEADKPLLLCSGLSMAIIGSFLVLVNRIPGDALGVDFDLSMASNRFVGYLSQPDQPVVKHRPSANDQDEDEDGAGRHSWPDALSGQTLGPARSQIAVQQSAPQLGMNSGPTHRPLAQVGGGEAGSQTSS